MKFFDKKTNLIFLLFGALMLRLVLSFFGTLNLDQGTFIAWAGMLAENGFKNFYNSWSDYFPGYLYVLFILGKINAVGIFPEPLLFKLPAIIADLLTGLVIYKILYKSKGEKWGLIGAAIYLFNPAIIANSTLWGQVDSLTALMSLFAIYQFPFSIYLSAASLAFGTLVKPQVAFVFPVILFLFLRDKRKFTELLAYCITGLVVFTLGFVPFWNHSNLISFIYERIGISLNQYPYLSVNAFNFWGIAGNWKPDSIYIQGVCYLLVSVMVVFLSFRLWRVKNAQYYLLSFIFAASFMFFTRMHERHLLPVFAPLIIAAIENPYLMVPYIGLSLTYVANIYYAYVWISESFKEVFSDFAIKLMEVTNVGFVAFIFYVLAKNINSIWPKIDFIKSKLNFGFKNNKTKVSRLPEVKMSLKTARLILIAIMVFGFATRVYSLGSPQAEYFDEVYHAFTAKVILHGDVKAWEWWNTPPEGFAYEWTHPPLAKLGMTLGMLIFGENSFGYRIPGAILGTGIILLIYLLAKEIFKDEVVGLLSAAVFSLDGLALVMSRIGMNDSYILFFTLLSLYLYLKDRNFLSALMFGFALASKWSAIWAIPIFGVIFLSRKKKLTLSCLWFFILPVVVYIAAYFDMFVTGHSLKTMWDMQQQMWWYHTGLRATHPYGSSWWTWPLLIRPIYLYTSDEIGGTVARIYAFGNPFVFWFGLVSVFWCLVYSFIDRNKNLALVVFSYLIFFVPWALSPRIMFLYHYLPSIPFLAIASGYVLRRNPKLIIGYLLVGLLVFIYFYSHWAGLRIPLWLDSSYYWISSWR
jgi:predicted membrane-bound dolichyl-phosphate-mannose-protein mannosyltransferase